MDLLVYNGLACAAHPPAPWVLHTHTSHHWTYACACVCVWVSTVLLAELYDEQEAKRKAADIAENGEPDSDDENTRLVRALWYCTVWKPCLTHSHLCPPFHMAGGAGRRHSRHAGQPAAACWQGRARRRQFEECLQLHPNGSLNVSIVPNYSLLCSVEALPRCLSPLSLSVVTIG